MTELRRLLDEDCDELAQAMLRAATDEEPPQGSLTAVAAALGVAPALTGLSWLGAGSAAAAAPAGASGAAGATNAGASLATVAAGGAGTVSAASSLSTLVVAKYVAIGMVGGLVAMGGMTLASSAKPKASERSELERSSAQQASVARKPPAAARALVLGEPASEPAGQAAVAAGEPAPKLPTRNAARPRPSDEPAASVAATTPDGAATASAAAFADESPKPAQRVEQNKGLTRELGLLDRARGALLAGNANEALGILDQYRKVRESMILDPEAEALRILALDRLGQHGTASRLAREFIASHPASRQVDSLRALAGKD